MILRECEEVRRWCQIRSLLGEQGIRAMIAHGLQGFERAKENEFDFGNPFYTLTPLTLCPGGL